MQWTDLKQMDSDEKALSSLSDINNWVSSAYWEWLAEIGNEVNDRWHVQWE